MTALPSPLPLKLKLIHGFGAVAFGIKDSGFSFFLLLFYSQVLNMDPGTVSMILLAALVIDGIFDPIIGNLSDRTYTRWGRRLPWLYIAPIPLAFAWILLWSPPGGEAPSVMGLLAITVVVRLLLSACEVPSVSLVPELTQDYVERTTLFRFRFLSGWLGGVLMMILAYTVFMPGAEGLLQADGYVPFGIFGGILMAVSVIGSALGQHHLVAHYPQAKPPPFSVKNVFGEIAEAFTERSFLIFALGGLAAYVSQGMTFSISNYLNLFVWQLDQAELVAYPVTLFFSVILMFIIVGPMHRRIGKPRSATIAAILSMAIGLTPYGLLLVGFWPEPGTLPSTIAFFAFLLLANMFGVVMMISATSMIAEIVEAFEERRHRRAEAAFYSGNWLIQKGATGVGIFLTGQILSFAELSSEADPGAVPFEVISDMILLYGIATIALALFAAFWLGRFPISQEEHERRVVALQERRTAALDAAARGDIDGGTIVP
ncbi:MFS transporter [Qipengyuania sp. JC766]|uniref:MFS transporter n=1 Tax=Qipengyuania sp. JC766 TaxID=3232139 RepID=UPI00345ACCC6